MICPLYPLHIILLYLCLALPFLLALVEGADTLAGWNLTFSDTKIGVGNETEKLRELTDKQFDVICSNCEQSPGSKYKLSLHNEDPNIAFIYTGDSQQDSEGLMELDLTGKARDWTLTVNVIEASS